VSSIQSWRCFVGLLLSLSLLRCCCCLSSDDDSTGTAAAAGRSSDGPLPLPRLRCSGASPSGVALAPATTTEDGEDDQDDDEDDDGAGGDDDNDDDDVSDDDDDDGDDDDDDDSDEAPPAGPRYTIRECAVSAAPTSRNAVTTCKADSARRCAAYSKCQSSSMGGASHGPFFHPQLRATHSKAPC
jgi:hypothetical protein